MSTVSAHTAALTGELAQVRESLARRLRGVDPTDFPALRRAYDAFAENDPMPDMATSSDIDPAASPVSASCPRAQRRSCRLLVHGGGFTMGSSRSHKGLATQVAAIARSAPSFPTIAWRPSIVIPPRLRTASRPIRRAGRGRAGAQFILAGDSAGGGLAVATALKLKGQGVDARRHDPALALGRSRQPRLEPRREGAARSLPHHQRAGTCARSSISAAAAPLSILDADLRGLPPTFIQTGEAEILMSDSTALAERLGAAGVPVTLEIWPDMFHVFQARYHAGQARHAIQRLGQWSAAHVAK